ncbi:AAA family ATPase [Actinomyces lilanjuaniae]|uniref:AAA family ATPase n=1 Tax=Actinomyces lilanjuaniae TaxID=2321394 RepID=UPI00196904F2|nr:hypothetical protein [Actinomyces lilanjuaniae]
MSTPRAGVLLALSGEDAEIVRALDQAGSGLSVVRRCADLPELLSAGMAGLASLVVLDTGFEEIDRTVLDRLGRAGLSGLLLVEPGEQERWRSVGWLVERRDAPATQVRGLLQDLARSRAGQPEQPGRAEQPGQAGQLQDHWPAQAGEAVQGAGAPLVAGSSSTPGSRLSSLPPGLHSPAPAPGGPGAASGVPEEVPWSPQAPVAGSGGEGVPPGEALGRLAVVWGTHGAPGRSTVAASLAHGLASAGGAVLADADVEAPCLVQLLGMPDDSSALAGAARLATHGRLDAESFSRFLASAGTNLHLLAGLGRAGRWRELPAASMTEVWLQCRRAAAWTVVDVSGGPLEDETDGFTFEPGRSAVACDLVSAADVVVVVGAADPVGVRRLVQLLADLDTVTTTGTRTEVVVNRVRASAAGPAPHRAVREAVERYGGVSRVVLLPEDAAAADRALLEGRSVLDAAPTSALGRALADLVDRVDPRAGAAARARGQSQGRGPRRLWAALRARQGQVPGWQRTRQEPRARARRRPAAMVSQWEAPPPDPTSPPEPTSPLGPPHPPEPPPPPLQPGPPPPPPPEPPGTLPVAEDLSGSSGPPGGQLVRDAQASLERRRGRHRR